MVATLDILERERAVIECLFWKEKALLTFKQRFLAPWPENFRLSVLEHLKEAVGGQLFSSYEYAKAKDAYKILLRDRYIVSHL